MLIIYQLGEKNVPLKGKKQVVSVERKGWENIWNDWEFRTKLICHMEQGWTEIENSGLVVAAVPA